MSISWMDVIAGALKFLVGMFWYRSSVPSEFFFPIACDIGTVLCLYWILSAPRTKPVKSRESLGQQLSYVLPSLSALLCSLIPALTIPGSACVLRRTRSRLRSLELC